MSEGRNAQNYIDYSLYEESEWRIIFSENLKKKLTQEFFGKYFIDPKNVHNTKYFEYYSSLPKDNLLEYLTPLDEWVSLIIYPNLQIKNASYNHKGIREELNKLKSTNKLANPELRIADGCPQQEIINQIVELDIGATKQF